MGLLCLDGLSTLDLIGLHIGLGVEEVIGKYQNIFSARTGSLKRLQASTLMSHLNFISPDQYPMF